MMTRRDRNWTTAERGLGPIGYHELGRVATVTATKFDGDPVNEVITYAYDAVGNLETLTLPNGVIATHTYDDLHRLTELVYEKDSQTIASFQYTLDDAGQRNQLDETIDGKSRTIQYDYDNLYRLVEEKVTNAHADLGGDYTQSWTHDLVGNRIEQVHSVNGTTTYTYNERDQLTESEIDSSVTTYEYDANGSMVKKTAGGQRDTYKYDIRNRMVEANVDGVALEYTYDHDGERVSKTADGVTEYYLLDKNNLTGYSQVLQQSATQGGSPDRTFVIGHRVLIQADGSTLRHLLHDGHGSVRAVLDATGQVATDQIYAYDAYGVRISPNSTILTPLQYAGEWFDDELGRSYNRARWYDPSLGRFDAFDPFEGNRANPLTLHKHLYVHGDPVNNIDPTGMFSLPELSVSIGKMVNIAGRALRVVRTIDTAINSLLVMSDVLRLIKGDAIGVIREHLTTVATQWQEAPAHSRTSNLFREDFWQDASQVLLKTAPDIVTQIMSSQGRKILEHYKKLKRRQFRWVIYMPSPAEPQLPNPLLRQRLPVFRILDRPVVIHFGPPGHGRLFGLGFEHKRKWQSQFFRMDYHGPHEGDWGVHGDSYYFSFHTPAFNRDPI